MLRADVFNPANGSPFQVRRGMGRHAQFVSGRPPAVALFLQPTGVAFHHRSQDRQGQKSTGILRKDLSKHQNLQEMELGADVPVSTSSDATH